MRPLFFVILLALLLVRPVDAQMQPEDQQRVCSGQFIAHDLDHMTTVPGGDQVRQFEANGSGVAINDLDNDHDLDIVLGNHAGMNTILWNEGGFNFRTEPMAHGGTRGVNIVDVDGDGWMDIVFTRIGAGPSYWRNMGNGQFEQQVLPGIAGPLYSASWADLDGDGDLDMVGATYDAELLYLRGTDFLASGDAGVYYYENNGGEFTQTRLADQAQGLALVLLDLNDDQRLDILVGNDFAVPDFTWYRTDDGWQQVEAFAAMTHSTMSFDFGDIHNDGGLELFATDMKPYADDPQTMAAWQPVMESMMSQDHAADDPQVMSNVLQITEVAGFDESAVESGVDATGWSWSSKFGDLDQDGFLDLYVVNGMMEATMFAHLPDHELVEENQALRNDRSGEFVSMPQWGLASVRSGRGMSMADIDGDGDLDIIVNNLRGMAQLFENQLCTGRSLQVDVRWRGTDNPYAVGAVLRLHTSAGTYQRQIRVSSGYLSGDTARVHFGFPDDAALQMLEIQWPDGVVTTVNTLTSNAIMRVERG